MIKMITTEELLAAAKKKSESIGKKKKAEKDEATEARKILKTQEKVAIDKWKEKMREGKLKRAFAKKARADLGKSSLKALKAIRRFGVKSIRKAVKESRRPTRRRPIPQQLRRPVTPRKLVPISQVPQRPMTVRDLQNAKSIKHLLTPEEQRIIERLFVGSRRAAAIQMVSRRMKEQEIVQERAMPRTIIKRDIMTGRDTIRREVPIERWLR